MTRSGWLKFLFFSFFKQFSTNLTFCQMLWLTSFSIEYGDDWAITESERKCKIHFYCSEIKCEAIVCVCCVPHLLEWPNVNERDTACVCVPNVFRLHFNSLPIWMSFVLSICLNHCLGWNIFFFCEWMALTGWLDVCVCSPFMTILIITMPNTSDG